VPEISYTGYKDLEELPTGTGCYIFKSDPLKSDQLATVLYVGKAKNLRSRVRQYFISEEGDGRAFSRFIRDRTKTIEFILVQTEQDALVLENELIKKHHPRYNIHLKDDKRYLTLRLDLQHEWPRIDIVRKIKKDGAVYLGPFSSSTRLRETLNLMQHTFPLRSCPDSKLYNRSRPCIEYDIKRCVAPCVAKISREDYSQLVSQAVDFLKGNSEKLLAELQAKMQTASEEEHYEEAASYRDRIRAVSEITQNQQQVFAHSHFQKSFDCDAVGFARDEERLVVVILFVRSGVILDQRSFDIKHKGLDEAELMPQFFDRYYTSDVYVPHEVLVRESFDNEDHLSPVNLVVPRAEEKRRFVEMADKNAQAQLSARREKREKLSAVLDSLQKKLGLRQRPTSMDCIDISHHQGEEVVASVVRFRDGVPEKDFYRRIRLHLQKVDDFASMREVVQRRYKQVEDLPDLVVVDGGRGQLSAAEESLRELQFLDHVELVSLAKARETGEPVDPFNPMNRERIFKIGQKNPLLLEKESAEELLLSFLRDEAHRFAITYHRKRRLDQISSSILDQIPGISSKQKIRLLKEFGSVAGIKAANDFDLLKVIKPKLLEKIREHIAHEESSDEELRDEEE
jgi:excinuclease ABC subunit C